SAYSEAPTHCPLVKHSPHTVKPLIAPHVDPFLPSVISTVQGRTDNSWCSRAIGDHGAPVSSPTLKPHPKSL
ncbi:unnamed protein product, partial [Staurois parvus]